MPRWVITLLLASAFVGGLAAPARADTISYLDDGVVRVGVDLDRGGLIVYLAPSGTDPSANLVDATLGDQGIQPWFQAGPDGFGNPAPPYESNPWNPSLGGDAFGNESWVDRYTGDNDGTTIHTETYPLQWALSNTSCTCTIEQWITLDGAAVKLRMRLELQYDHKLSGHPGKQTIVRDATGRSIDVISSSPVQEGSAVFTTIDHTIQSNAEQVLRATVSEWGARGATAIVLDPRTGDVLAMAQAPGYDANNTGSAGPNLTRNRAVTDTYEPGSTFKLVTVTGVLSEGLVKPTTRFTLPVCIQVANYCIHDAEGRNVVNYSVAQILQYSSNVGAITLAEKLGAPALARWIDRFGFGHPTGIDFPGESSGLVLPLEQWSGSTIGNVPIGQGIAVTPIQMASVYAAVANDGVWVQPHLVTRVGGRAPFKPARRRIMSTAVDRQVKSMLTGVVLAGTGTAAAIPGYTVAGKTGTGSIPGPHGYADSLGYMASFVGMVPASDPRLVVLVVVDRPRGAIFGGVVAAPAFQSIAKFDLQYLEVPPDAPRTALSATG